MIFIMVDLCDFFGAALVDTVILFWALQGHFEVLFGEYIKTSEVAYNFALCIIFSRWTSEADSSLKYGHPELHLVCALRFWKGESYLG